MSVRGRPLRQHAQPARRRAASALASGRDVRQALARSETTLKQTLELTQTGSWDWDIRTNVVRWSENLGPIHGLPPGSSPRDYDEYLQLVHPDDRARIGAAVDAAVRRGRGYEIELRTAPRDGDVRWLLAHANVICDAHGAPRTIVGLTRDITDRKRREERDQFLAEAAQLLAGATAHVSALEGLARLAAARVADWCVVDLVGPPPRIVSEGGEAGATEGDAGATVGRALAGAFGAHAVARAGGALLCRELGELYAEAASVQELKRREIRSVATAPLIVADRIQGALVLAATAERRRYDDEDVDMLEELARRTALGVAGALAFETAEKARREAGTAAEHATRLQEVTAGLSAAATTPEIAEVIIEQGIPALAATTGILAVLEEPGVLRFVRTSGYGDVFPEQLSLDEPWPITEAVRTGRLVELRDLPERRARFAVPERIWDESGHGTLVAVPLLVRDRPVGALGFTREKSARLTESERDLVETLARQAAQALERASLYEADRRARLQAEGLQRVTSAVATAATTRDVAEAVASEALGVLDASGVTVILARAAESTIGDVLASHGTVATYAVSEPQMNFESETVTAAAIRSETPLFVETRDELEASWPVSADVARELGIGAIACIPLRVEGRRGAVSIVFERSRRFLPQERTFLDVLARTCEQGLLRAALYEAEREARRRSGILHDLSATLSGAVALSDVGSAFLEHALEYLHAGSGSLMLADAADERLTAVAIGGSGSTRSVWASSLPVDGKYVISTSFRRGEPIAAWTRELLERDFAATAGHFGPAAQAAYARPLVFGGRKIGAFGLVFESERKLSADDERLLATMSDLCGQAIERARLYESEHQIAHRLQNAMLPERVLVHPSLELAAHYQAGIEAMEVGGDWYDAFSLPDGKVGIAVGDVLGQGIEAAAAMGRLRSALAAYALEASGPADLMERLNRFAATPSGVEFATACYAVVDTRSGALSYASAGHPPILLSNAEGRSRWLDGGRTQPFCGSPAFKAIEASEQLEPGDLLLLYSDGLIERRGEHIEVGLERLEAAVRSLRDLPADELCHRLVEQLRADSRQPDDIVVVAVRAVPVADRAFRRVFPARPEELRVVRAAAREWLTEREPDPSRRNEILLALGEACANAVEHAYNGASGNVEVEMAARDGELTLSVSDRGTWRDRAVRDPDRGRGYRIMQAVSSRVDVDVRPDGTTVTMHFTVAGAARE